MSSRFNLRWCIFSVSLMLSATLGLTSCEPEIIYNTRDLTIDLNACLSTLNFDDDTGCSATLEVSPDGCFVIGNDRGELHRLPIRYTSDGLEPISEGDLIGDLVFELEEGGSFSILLFGQSHNTAPDRCDNLTLESVCDGDCKVALINQPLTLMKLNRQFLFEATECLWEASPQRPLAEVICDGRDNDCDGVVDEVMALESDPTGDAPPQLGDACALGVGECEVEGIYACLDGPERLPRCNATPREGEPERCDGLDNDCNGEVDELFGVGEPCEVSRGICKTIGVYACVSESDASATPSLSVGERFCQINDPDPEARRIELEVGGECNGADDDCDGFTDEHYIQILEGCGSGACAAEALTVCEDGVTTSLCRDGEPMGADDNCDNFDDDCDGRADEGYLPVDRRCGIGACKSTGLVLCQGGDELAICEPNDPPGLDDDCDGLDDNCNGTPDDNYVERESECGVGECFARGRFVCDDGREVNTCVPGEPTSDQNCNGLDDDCDGRTDEDYIPTATVCGDGICRTSGRLLCVSGGLVDTCSPSPPRSQIDLCDGLDLDCDGAVDEDHIEQPTLCGVGICASAGVIECRSGQTLDTCEEGEPAPADLGDAICDTLDSDCDGRTDEGYVGTSVDCGVGACSAAGVTLCVNGQTNTNTCVPRDSTLVDDSCDGADQDCDGQIDEHYQSIATTCGRGICASMGATLCVGGAVLDSCEAGAPNNNDASCDQLDSDCDGRVDEDYPVRVTTCGVGVCASSGLRTCSNGQELNSCEVGAPSGNDDNCDGLDDNCDGTIDENFSGNAVTCGVGACVAQGTELCLGAQVREVCSPGTPGAIDRCDNIDNDCDGKIDEDHQVIETFCGVGECARAGERVCVNGVEVDNCTPNSPGVDDSCDQRDNDCDGSFDEHYVPEAVTCPPGSCEPSGFTVCTLTPPLGDTCVESQVDVDLTCDGVDDDCDGSIDEDHVPPIDNTVCGVGACLVTTGVLECNAGNLQSVCEPSDPQGPDNNCNGIDEDCDEQVDEGYFVEVECGLGQCRRVVLEACTDGVTSSDCVPGTRQSDFDLCSENPVDDNCDGMITNYPELGQTCTVGVGECTATGFNVCNDALNGVQCGATPGIPTAEECDDLDNDCNGVVDDIEEIPCNNLDDDCDGTVDEENIDGAGLVSRGQLCSDDDKCRWRCYANEPSLICGKKNRLNSASEDCPL